MYSNEKEAGPAEDSGIPRIRGETIGRTKKSSSGSIFTTIWSGYLEKIPQMTADLREVGRGVGRGVFKREMFRLVFSGMGWVRQPSGWVALAWLPNPILFPPFHFNDRGSATGN